MKALFSSVVQIVEWILRYEDYKEHLVDQAALMLTISGRVSETTQILTTQFNFRLRTPDLYYHCEFSLLWTLHMHICQCLHSS